MQTSTVKIKEVVKHEFKRGARFSLPVKEFRALQIPNIEDARLGVCYVSIADLPSKLEQYTDVNPRVPSRTKRGSLSGPIIKAILKTLRERPEELALMNQGIYILVDEMDASRSGLELTLTDKSKHGIVNGGHTYAAVREALETFEGEELARLSQAYVRLHLFQNIPKQLVTDIAEGLNRSKQVDDLSLLNLQGDFDYIRSVLKGVQGADNVAYFQGDQGSVYISELLVYLELMNFERFTDSKHPNTLYNKHSLGLKYFAEDMRENKNFAKLLVDKLPEFLKLADTLRLLTPEASKRNRFKFGLAKVDSEGKRAGTAGRETYLNFIGETMPYKIPNGWLFPMLSAFRANLKLSKDSKSLEWIVPLSQIVPDLIDSLVAVCVKEHKAHSMRPELIGKQESAYAQCFNKVQMYLVKKGY